MFFILKNFTCFNLLCFFLLLNFVQSINEFNYKPSPNIFSLKFYTYNMNNSISSSLKSINPINIWSYNQLYTNINFGPSKIPLCILITSEDYGFYLINGYGPMQNQYNSTINKTRGIFAYKSFHCAQFINENFYLTNEQNDEVLVNNFEMVDNCRENYISNFFLKIKNNENNIHNVTFGILGLELQPKYRYEVLENFVIQLKKKKYISNYYWNLKYDENNNNEGYLKIGEVPECYKNEKFYKETKSLRYQMFIQWDLLFKEIYLYSSKTKDKNINKTKLLEEKNDDSINAIIDFNYGLITGTNHYYDLIKADFFEYYIYSSICFENTTQTKDGSNKLYFYCLKDKFSTNDINSFPTLFFFHEELNYTFELNYKDLFRYNGKYIYFLILFENYNKKLWTLGKIFLKKYRLYFNHDTKMIGFCSYFNEHKINNSDSKIFLLIFVVFTSCAIFYALKKGISKIIGKKTKNYEIEFELKDEKK